MRLCFENFNILDETAVKATDAQTTQLLLKKEGISLIDACPNCQINGWEIFQFVQNVRMVAKQSTL